MPNQSEVITRALATANRIRRIFGDSELKAMPQGDREEAEECPLANAIGHGVAVQGETLEFQKEHLALAAKIAGELNSPKPDLTDWGTWRVRAGDAINTFVTAFDEGQFPELDLNYEEPCGDPDCPDCEWIG